jgi:uncharacterized protein YndB with AHSA1/START domain
MQAIPWIISGRSRHVSRSLAAENKVDKTMSKLFIEKSVEINAPASKVWRVFTDPVLTRQMGGEYVSDWKVGSSFGWKGLDGKMITNGAIMKIVPEKLLQHTLLNSVESANSVITYEFAEKNHVTIVHAREDFTQPIADNEYAEVVKGWEAALLAVKETAEK